jgi:hypothetical protein
MHGLALLPYVSQAYTTKIVHSSKLLREHTVGRAVVIDGSHTVSATATISTGTPDITTMSPA